MAVAFAAVSLLPGFAFGSFLNVVAARVPLRRSVVNPSSACMACATPLARYDNIPLLSFALLRGRCRHCAATIPWRYPVVEAVTGALFGAAALAFGATLHAVVACAMLAALVAITMIDLERHIIPDVISLPGTLAGVLANLATGRVSWKESVVGVVVGGGVFLTIALVGS